jgi:hypothetical protein
MSFIGFDVRMVGNFERSVDATLWPQNGLVYEELLYSGAKENYIQLLDCDSEVIENCVNSRECVGVAITACSEAVRYMNRVFSYECSGGAQFLDGGRWEFIGYDVADVNGFFSPLGMDEEIRAGLNFVSIGKDMEMALRVSELANELVPSHAPFYPFGLYVFVREV